MSKKVLVVDDDKLIRTGLADMLRGQQHEVFEAEDGKQGLEVALQQHPDLIITDIMMPVMTGSEMITELRKDGWGATAAVIVLSNDESTPTINEALQAGTTAYLSKPSTDPDSLVQQIKTGLGGQ
jgi:CheY-like chemotaxis protein